MNKLIGNHGEDIAANYYLNNGYTTLDRNFLIKKGELDLIVKKDDVIVFDICHYAYTSSMDATAALLATTVLYFRMSYTLMVPT